MTSRSTPVEHADVTAGIVAIRDGAPARVHVTATGAGAGIQRALWDVPGISSFFVGAAFPYAAEETTRVLGFRPESFCAQETAVDLATASFVRAAASGAGRAVGVGLTAAVASRTSRRGDHRAYAAYVTDEGAAVASLLLPKDAAADARERDGALCDALGLDVLLAAFGARLVGAQTVITPCDALAHARLFARPLFGATGARATAVALPDDVVFFPGAFNPPHDGHFGGARLVARTSGRRVVFSTTIDPPHKAALSTAEVLRRVAMLEGHDVLFTEGDPLYLDKARRFPGRGFVIGADALVRMLDPKWGPDVPSLVAEFSSLGTRFFVIPRVIDGALVALDDIRRAPVIGAYASALDAVGVDGRWDVSSTALREAAGR